MSVLTVTPKFLYPRSRQFPIDEVVEKIVMALERRNWKVPGITVEFDTYGSGEAKYQMVREITGDNFRLYFCRVQGKLNGKWNNTAALRTVCIPKQILDVYEDESGPGFCLYVGDNWVKDKQQFMNSIKVHSKMDNKPRTYLKYSGHGYNRRPRELVADNDLEREYDPEGNEPTSFNLESVFLNINIWLVLFVLNYILRFPKAKILEPPVPMEKLIPYNGPWPTVFSMCGWEAAERILKGKEDPKELAPEDRHAHFGSDHRLVPLDVWGDDRFPKIAYEGFIWCDVNQGITPNSKRADISGEIKLVSSFDSSNIVAIKLKYANHVYVMDQSAFDETSRQLFEAIAPRDRLTGAEVNTAYVARGATIVPITEYKGNYKDPILLINRELDFDEIKWIADITEKQ